MNDEPEDEKNSQFKAAFELAKENDEDYQKELEKIENDDEDDDIDEKIRDLDRSLKDKIRLELSMPPRPVDQDTQSLKDHARINNIDPSFELPHSDFSADDDRHEDDLLQTLQLSENLNAKLRKIFDQEKQFREERGIHTLYLILGYLSWSDPKSNKNSLYKSPLLLIPLSIRRSIQGKD